MVTVGINRSLAPTVEVIAPAVRAEVDRFDRSVDLGDGGDLGVSETDVTEDAQCKEEA